MNIYLVRHTIVGIGKGICYGQADVEPASTFHEDVFALKKKLPQKTDVVYASPLKRCARLAEALGAHSWRTDERLKELNFGEWESMRWDAIDPGVLQAWMDDYVNVRCPDGESFKELYARATDFWRELIDQKVKSALVVTHGGVVRSLVAHALEIPLHKAFAIEIAYGSVTKLTYRKGVTVLKYLNY